MQIDSWLSDYCVIQQHCSFIIRGISLPQKSVSMVLTDESNGSEILRSQVGTDSEGRFEILLDTPDGNFTSYTLQFCCDNDEIKIVGLLFGEVFLTSGQSNMSFPVRDCQDAAELRKMVSPKIRFIHFGDMVDNSKNMPIYPVENAVNTTWKWEADDAEMFSAVSLAFANKICEELNVPVGIVDTANGGTVIECWVSRSVIEQEKICPFVKAHNRYITINDFNKKQSGNFSQMTGLYNERIYPYRNMPFRAIIWLQGESNAWSDPCGEYYEIMLRELVRSWRHEFSSKLPFYVCHIAQNYYPPNSQVVYHINSAMDKVAQSEEEVYSIPVYDLPMQYRIEHDLLRSDCIHTSCKVPYGERIANVVIASLYKKPANEIAPILKNIEFCEGFAYVTFDHTGNGLCTTNNGPVRGFVAYDSSETAFESAAEIISKDCVKVACGQKAVQISYADFMYNQCANLCNSNGVAAIPFRTKYRKKVFEPHEWLYLERDKQWNIHTDNSLGSAFYTPTWFAGRISFSNGVHLSHDNGCLIVEYDPPERSCWGISPKLCSAGRRARLEDYSFIEVVIENPESHDKIFFGGAILLQNGEIYHLPVNYDGQLTDHVKLSAGKTIAYTIDLKSYLTAFSSPYLKSVDMSKVVEIELIFKDPLCSKGQILLHDIVLK